MKRLRKPLLLLLTISFVVGGLYSEGWAQKKPTNDMLNIIDLFIVRPVSVVAAAAGTGLFILSLPFTLPTRSTEDSFNMFVVQPWKFSFVREFPEEQFPEEY
jgi:hypothetical protein